MTVDWSNMLVFSVPLSILSFVCKELSRYFIDMTVEYNPCHTIHKYISSYSTEEKFEDTKGVIRISKSNKDRQHNGHTKKDK